MDYSKLVLKTEWATDPETGLRYKARYGFDGAFALRHKQAPYLSVCYDLYEVTPMGRLRDVGGGPLRQEVADRLFPGPIAGLVPFHLCSATEGPMHYLANTIYLAGDRDHWGLRKGERQRIRSGSSNLPMWDLRIDDGSEFGGDYPSDRSVYSETEPVAPKLRWFPYCRIGEGKERQFDLARQSACWPEATDEELSAPPEELRKMLEARLPALLVRMRAACEAAGLLWPGD